MIVTHKLSMDLLHRSANPPVLDMVVGDGESRAVKLLFMAGNDEWTIPELTAVRINFAVLGSSESYHGSYDTLSDGTKAWSVEGNSLTFLLAPQVTAHPGLVEVQVELQQEGKTLSTFVIHLDVQRNVPYVEGFSENYVNWSAWALEQIDAAVEQIKELGGIHGDDGVGIASIQQTTTSKEDDGTNVVTVTLTDGSSAMFTVKNGSKGSAGPQGAAGQAGADGVGIASIVQTTASKEDGGKNVITVTLTDGETAVFTVYNGSKGSDADISALEARIAALEARVAALESGSSGGSSGGSGNTQLATPVIQLYTNN